MIKIELPSIEEQEMKIYELRTDKACEKLKENLKAKDLRSDSRNKRFLLDKKFLLTEDQGWTPPDHETLNLLFKQFQELIPDYSTDKKLSELLGVTRVHSIREWKSGHKKIPYGIWRKFLVVTGRVVQDIIPVIAFI